MPDRPIEGNAADGSAETDPAAAIAAAIEDAAFVRLLTPPDGDGVAATGILMRSLGERSVPFQARVHRWPGARADERSSDSAESDDWRASGTITIAIGRDTGPASVVLHRHDGPASPVAYRAAELVGTDPDPVLALAGTVSAGWPIDDDAAAPLLDAADVDRSAGIAAPTADVVDGLAHTTLLHAPFSGDVETARSLIEDTVGDVPDGTVPETMTEEASIAVASMAALETVAAPSANGRAAAALDRGLNPHRTPAGPFPTVEGYGDLLSCVATDDPGTALAIAAGHPVRDDALTAWRSHAERAHLTARDGPIERVADVAVVRAVDAPVGSVARLARDFRVPEPIVAAVADGRLAVAVADDAPGTVESTLETLVGAVEVLGGEPRRRTTPPGLTVLETDDAVAADRFVDAIREAIDP